MHKPADSLPCFLSSPGCRCCFFFGGGGQWYHKQAAAEARMRAAIDSGDAAALEAAIQQCNDLGVPCGTATKVSWNECACIEQAQEQQQGAERERGGGTERAQSVCVCE